MIYHVIYDFLIGSEFITHFISPKHLQKCNCSYLLDISAMVVFLQCRKVVGKETCKYKTVEQYSLLSRKCHLAAIPLGSLK